MFDIEYGHKNSENIRIYQANIKLNLKIFQVSTNFLTKSISLLLYLINVQHIYMKIKPKYVKIYSENKVYVIWERAFPNILK